MKFIVNLFLLFTPSLFAQDCKYWYAFENEDSRNTLSKSLVFKDCHGNTMTDGAYISPMTNVKRFEKIIALTEYSNEKSTSYYLNKQKKKFGIDSLYTFDLSHDVEQEGFIRFSVGNYLDSIGLFDSNGKIKIEPKYNALSKVNNGLLYAKIGAKQKHEKHNHGDCDHWSFEGGKNLILDSSGTVLIDDFKDENLSLDLFSLKVSEQKTLEKYRHNYLGANNKYYSFISFRDEFKDFINTTFIQSIGNQDFYSLLIFNIQQSLGFKSNQRLDREVNWIIKTLKSKTIKFSEFSYFFVNEDDVNLVKSIEKYLNNSNEINIDINPIFEINCTDPIKRKEIYITFIKLENQYEICDIRTQEYQK